MKTLREFQQQFSDNMLSVDVNDQFLQQLNSMRETKKCFSVYRNNTFHSLCEALGDTYPVTKRLLGDTYFKQIAIDFVRYNPPSQPCLSFYGNTFSIFLKTHALTNALSYLPDVALLEWYYQKAFHSQDQPTLNLTVLQAVAAEQLQHIRLIPLQSVHLFSSAFPVDVIWEENLKADVATIDLNKHSPCHLLIYRPAADVKIIALGSNTFTLLEKLCASETLEQAAQTTDMDAEEFSAQLSYLLSLQMFSDYAIDGNND